MTTTYWAQWSRADILSMHGIEVEDYEVDDDHADDGHLHMSDEEREECCCSLCMECLGLSWRDFM